MSRYRKIVGFVLIALLMPVLDQMENARKGQRDQQHHQGLRNKRATTDQLDHLALANLTNQDYFLGCNSVKSAPGPLSLWETWMVTVIVTWLLLAGQEPVSRCY